MKNPPALSAHRRVHPHGLFGGKAGQLGRTQVRRLDCGLAELESCDQTVLHAGEAVIVATPTAGGFGA